MIDKEQLEMIVFKVSTESVGYALCNVECKTGDAELDAAAKTAQAAIEAFEGRLETLMEEHEIEYS